MRPLFQWKSAALGLAVLFSTTHCLAKPQLQCDEADRLLARLSAPAQKQAQTEIIGAWRQLVSSKCWAEDKAIQVKAAKFVATVAPASGAPAYDFLRSFTQPEACCLLFDELLRARKVSYLLCEGLQLLDQLPPDQGQIRIQELYREYSDGQFREVQDDLCGTDTAELIARAVAIMPYEGAEKDLASLLLKHPSEQVCIAYVVVCYKQHTHFRAGILDRMIESDNATPFRYLWSLSGLRSLLGNDTDGLQRLQVRREQRGIDKLQMRELRGWIEANYSHFLQN